MSNQNQNDPAEHTDNTEMLSAATLRAAQKEAKKVQKIEYSASPVVRGKRASRPFGLYLLLVLLLAGGGVYGYFRYLERLFPKIPEIPEAEYLALREIALSSPQKVGPRAKVFLKGISEGVQTAYLVSNLPDGTEVQLSLKGKPKTLLNGLRGEWSGSGSFQKHLARLDLKLGDGLPVGFYQFSVQGSGVEIDQEVFLGKEGPEYQTALNTYHAKLSEETVGLLDLARTKVQAWGDLLKTKALKAKGKKRVKAPQGPVLTTQQIENDLQALAGLDSRQMTLMKEIRSWASEIKKGLGGDPEIDLRALVETRTREMAEKLAQRADKIKTKREFPVEGL